MPRKVCRTPVWHTASALCLGQGYDSDWRLRLRRARRDSREPMTARYSNGTQTPVATVTRYDLGAIGEAGAGERR